MVRRSDRVKMAALRPALVILMGITLWGMIQIAKLYAIGSMSFPRLKPYYRSVDFTKAPAHASTTDQSPQLSCGPRR